MSNGWNPERRMRQAMLIQTWKPWQQATGPKTDSGKKQSARNAYKGEQHQMCIVLQQLKQLMKQQKAIVEETHLSAEKLDSCRNTFL